MARAHGANQVQGATASVASMATRDRDNPSNVRIVSRESRAATPAAMCGGEPLGRERAVRAARAHAGSRDACTDADWITMR